MRQDNNIVGQDDIYTILKKYQDYCNEMGIEVRNDHIYWISKTLHTNVYSL